MLKALRARTGWRRALALALLFAFTTGVLHVHGTGPAAAQSAVELAAHHDDNHGHDDGDGPSVSSHCTYCAVVTGKFYLPSYEAAYAPAMNVRVVYGATSAPAPLPTSTDLFRPPIAHLS